MQVLSSDFSSTFIVRRLDNTSLTDSALVGIMEQAFAQEWKIRGKKQTPKKQQQQKTDKIQY